MTQNQEDEPYFANEEGFTALTEEYLLQRGYCCGNGCRNCPYEYKNVPEPRRTELLNERKKKQQKK